MPSTCLSCIGPSFICFSFSFFFFSSRSTHTTTHTFSLLPLLSLLSRRNRYAEYLLLLPVSPIFLSQHTPLLERENSPHVFFKSINLRSVRVRVGGFHFSFVSTFNSLLPLPLFYHVIFLGNIIILSSCCCQLLTEA